MILVTSAAAAAVATVVSAVIQSLVGFGLHDFRNITFKKEQDPLLPNYYFGNICNYLISCYKFLNCLQLNRLPQTIIQELHHLLCHLS